METMLYREPAKPSCLIFLSRVAITRLSPFCLANSSLHIFILHSLPSTVQGWRTRPSVRPSVTCWWYVIQPLNQSSRSQWCMKPKILSFTACWQAFSCLFTIAICSPNSMFSWFTYWRITRSSPVYSYQQTVISSCYSGLVGIHLRRWP